MACPPEVIARTTGPTVLADLGRGRRRQKVPPLRLALLSHFRFLAFLVSRFLAQGDYLDEASQLSADTPNETARATSYANDLHPEDPHRIRHARGRRPDLHRRGKCAARARD